MIRGTFFFDLDFARKWDQELVNMSYGKRGSPYLFPHSFMKFMMIWKQFLDYRALEGMARTMVGMGIIPDYGDYTTIWHRIHDMKPALDISGLKYADLGTDGTGLKTNNAGTYRIMKYCDPVAHMRKHLVVIITADARTKRILGIESHVKGSGSSEPETAGKHMKGAILHGIKVREFYVDCAFDVNDLFDLVHTMNAKPVIRIRKNASTDHSRGIKYRRKERWDYRNRGYRTWAEENHYGMRWSGTEGIFSAVKRKFGENCVSRSSEGLEAEGYQRFWIYNYINNSAREASERKIQDNRSRKQKIIKNQWKQEGMGVICSTEHYL